MAGFQTLTTWQDSQRSLARMCAGFLPVARVPLWQPEQLAVMPVCSNVAGDQAVVWWQFSQVLPVGRCRADLPVAVVPLWQAEQPLVTPVWSKRRTGVHEVVE